MNDVFDEIYKNKIWMCGDVLSGAGSDPYSAKDYIEYLTKFKDRNVLDLGCGDLSIYSNNIFFKSYVGVDVVDIKKYKTLPNNIQLVQSSIDDLDFNKYNFDLIILKDVLQHLSNDRICHILNKLVSVNVETLITNDFNFNSINLDCVDGEHHYLNMELSPFTLTPKETYDWTSYYDNRIKRTILCYG